MSPEKKKLAIRLLIHALVLIPLYFCAPVFGFHYMHYVYLALGGGLALWYVIYNKGFVYRGLTPDQIAGDAPEEEKAARIETMRRRFDSSRWVLTVLIPILLTFLFDFVYLFILPGLENFFA